MRGYNWPAVIYDVGEKHQTERSQQQPDVAMTTEEQFISAADDMMGIFSPTINRRYDGNFRANWKPL